MVTSSNVVEIAIINASTVVSDQDVSNCMIALQSQVSNDFKPIWGGVGASLRFIPKGQKPPANAWWLSVLDNSDQAGALGYHDMTPTGLPLGKIFVKTDIQYKVPWSTTASHELMEMLGDPWIMACVEVDDKGTFFAQETADACENDSYSITVSKRAANSATGALAVAANVNIEVSDFVYPAWFNQNLPAGTQYDHLGLIKDPLALREGGYIGFWTPIKGWQQAFGNEGANDHGMATGHPEHLKQIAPVGSRRERRARGKGQWVASTVEMEEAV